MPSSLPRFADATLPGGRAANILAAARALAPHLARGRALVRRLVSGVLNHRLRRHRRRRRL